MGCSKSSFNKEIYSNTILPKKTRKISNKQPYLTRKATREKNNNKISRRQEIIKIRAEINKENKNKDQ